jgi:hypothetical protein
VDLEGEDADCLIGVMPVVPRLDGRKGLDRPKQLSLRTERAVKR